MSLFNFLKKLVGVKSEEKAPEVIAKITPVAPTPKPKAKTSAPKKPVAKQSEPVSTKKISKKEK